jgi:Icc protein
VRQASETRGQRLVLFGFVLYGFVLFGFALFGFARAGFALAWSWRRDANAPDGRVVAGACTSFCGSATISLRACIKNFTSDDETRLVNRTIAHLSDLHLGLGPGVVGKAEAFADALIEAEIDHVVVTGDLTEAGRVSAYRDFQRVFAPLIDSGRVTIVPGNHDRLGDDVGRDFMDGRRVDVVKAPGLHVVRIDSTGPHNRSSIVAAHGLICSAVLDQLETALAEAGSDELCVILLHHHPVPLPGESFFERLSCSLGLPYARELTLGHELLRRALGRCDLVLHGHRHVPAAAVLDPQGARPLRIYNAGSSVERGGMHVFSHKHGQLLGSPTWLAPAAPWVGGVVGPSLQAAEVQLAALSAA